jgi:hypothetical protein
LFGAEAVREDSDGKRGRTSDCQVIERRAGDTDEHAFARLEAEPLGKRLIIKWQRVVGCPLYGQEG